MFARKGRWLSRLSGSSSKDVDDVVDRATHGEEEAELRRLEDGQPEGTRLAAGIGSTFITLPRADRSQWPSQDMLLHQPPPAGVGDQQLSAS